LPTTTNPTDQAITKYASDGDKADAIELVRARSVERSLGHSMGIAHTRWATHGMKTDENAHPHTDASGTIALVHNGTINNAGAIRRNLQGKGYAFTGTTDSEVLAQLIGHYYRRAVASGQKPSSLLVKLATEKALSRCDGSWGLCVMCADVPSELIVACNGSPMMIGLADDRTYVASEVSAFVRHTKNFIPMKDGEIGILHADAHTFDLTTRTEQAPDEIAATDDFADLTTPHPYGHWTLKEIYEQPEAIARALGFGGRLATDKVSLGGLDMSADRIRKIRHMTLSACGSSLHAAMYGERIMKQLSSFDRVTTIDAAELDEDDLQCPLNLKETGFIALSQSGETTDVIHALKVAMEKDVTCMSVVNTVGSTVARMTKMGVYCNAGKENAVTSTKTFATQVVALALIALWFRQERDSLEGRKHNIDTLRLKESLMRLPITFGMALKLHDQCKEIAKRLNPKEHCFVLGKGFAEPIALEGAMKIKEMSYLHAEGYSGGALKHGPFALIENDATGKFGSTPIIMFILDDGHAHHMRIAAEETKARGADLIM
jgi:glutamine---fructose-6-phosphate transaminase (isomerizing)